MNSDEQLIGKAGEHLVCANLLTKGYKAFLADYGTNYDIIVEVDSKLLKVNVKTTCKPYLLISDKHNEGYLETYRFTLKCSKNSSRAYNMVSCDFFAFVMLDQMKIAYMPIKDIVSVYGDVKQMIEFKSKKFDYGKRKQFGKFLEDFAEFKP